MAHRYEDAGRHREDRYRRDDDGPRGGSGGGRDRDRDRDKDFGDRYQNRPPRSMTCFGCGQPGHHVRNCPEANSNGQGRGGKRGRDEVEAEPYDEQHSLKSLVVRIGEKSSSSLESNMERMVAVFSSDLAARKELLLATLLDSVVRQPGKTAVYGTLAGLFNAEHPDLGADIVRRTQLALRDALSSGNQVAVRALLRFVAELVNSRTIAALDALRVMQAYATTISSQSLPQARADMVVLNLLTAIPAAAPIFSSLCYAEFERLLETIGGYINTRNVGVYELLQIFPGAAAGSGDALGSFYQAVKKCQSSDWKSDAYSKPYKHCDVKLSRAKTWPFALESIPALKSGASRACPVRSDFRIFSDNDEFNTGISAADRFLAAEIISDVIYVVHTHPQEAAAQLLQLSIPFNYLHILVEVFFSLLFALPQTTRPSSYYAILMVHLFASEPKLHPIVGRSINNVFNLSDDMEAECRDRFVRWFAFHISQFQFLWVWGAWAPVLSMDESSQRHRTVRMMLARVIRLSYRDRIAKELPIEFHALLPPKPDPVLPSDSALQAHISALVEHVRSRPTPQSIPDWLRSRCDPGITDADLLRILLLAFLQLGQKSFSHFIKITDGYRVGIDLLNKDETSQSAIVEAVATFWSSSVVHVSALLHHLQTVGAVSCRVVCRWAIRNSTMRWREELWSIVTDSMDLAVLDVARKPEEVEMSGDEQKQLPRLRELFNVVDEEFRAAYDAADGPEDQKALLARYGHVKRYLLSLVGSVGVDAAKDAGPFQAVANQLHSLYLALE